MIEQYVVKCCDGPLLVEWSTDGVERRNGTFFVRGPRAGSPRAERERFARAMVLVEAERTVAGVLSEALLATAAAREIVGSANEGTAVMVSSRLASEKLIRSLRLTNRALNSQLSQFQAALAEESSKRAELQGQISAIRRTAAVKVDALRRRASNAKVQLRKAREVKSAKKEVRGLDEVVEAALQIRVAS